MTRTNTRRSQRCLRTGLAVTTVIAVLVGCSDSTSPDKSGTFFGPPTAMAGGTARSYVTLDRRGAPTDLGVALTEATLVGLPSASTEFVLELPSQASATPFKHAVVDWQPTGHPPAGIYTVPHFDVHFYMITQAERSAIVLGDADLAAKMVRQPAAEFVPNGYVTGMSAVRMGMHWNDPLSPERNGQPFTQSFIYGSYDGTFVFAEPMVAKAYLETKPVALVTPIKLPARYAAVGYQPTSYTVAYDAPKKEYRVALSDLVQR